MGTENKNQEQDSGMEQVNEMIGFMVTVGTAMSAGIQGMEQKLAKPSQVLMLRPDSDEKITLLEFAQQFERFVTEVVGIGVERHLIDLSERGQKH